MYLCLYIPCGILAAPKTFSTGCLEVAVVHNFCILASSSQLSPIPYLYPASHASHILYNFLYHLDFGLPQDLLACGFQLVIFLIIEYFFSMFIAPYHIPPAVFHLFLCSSVVCIPLH